MFIFIPEKKKSNPQQITQPGSTGHQSAHATALLSGFPHAWDRTNNWSPVVGSKALTSPASRDGRWPQVFAAARYILEIKKKTSMGTPPHPAPKKKDDFSGGQFLGNFFLVSTPAVRYFSRV